MASTLFSYAVSVPLFGRARIVDFARVPIESPTVRVAVGERIVEVAGIAGIVEIDEPVLDLGTAGEVILRGGSNWSHEAQPVSSIVDPAAAASAILFADIASCSPWVLSCFV